MDVVGLCLFYKDDEQMIRCFIEMITHADLLLRKHFAPFNTEYRLIPAIYKPAEIGSQKIVLSDVRNNCQIFAFKKPIFSLVSCYQSVEIVERIQQIDSLLMCSNGNKTHYLCTPEFILVFKGDLMFGQSLFECYDVHHLNSASTPDRLFYWLPNCDFLNLMMLCILQKTCFRVAYAVASESVLLRTIKFNQLAGHYLTDSRGDSEVQKVKIYSNLFYMRTLTLPMLANEVNLSERQLLNRFRKDSGETVFNYVRQVRLVVAGQYLKYSYLGGDEISARVGYSNGNSFRRLFKKSNGKSMECYRSQI